MSIAQSFIPEIDQEAGTTRRVLERVPGDKLTWKPHEKSMSLGQLALHVAGIPGQVTDSATPDSVPLPPPEQFGNPPQPDSADELLPALDAAVAKAKDYLGNLSDERIMAEWSATANGKVAMTMPRVGLLRAIMLNHWYHHRGQLSVYLRLLDVPVPSIYGPSADENPWA